METFPSNYWIEYIGIVAEWELWSKRNLISIPLATYKSINREKSSHGEQLNSLKCMKEMV